MQHELIRWHSGTSTWHLTSSFMVVKARCWRAFLEHTADGEPCRVIDLWASSRNHAQLLHKSPRSQGTSRTCRYNWNQLSFDCTSWSLVVRKRARNRCRSYRTRMWARWMDMNEYEWMWIELSPWVLPELTPPASSLEFLPWMFAEQITRRIQCILSTMVISGQFTAFIFARPTVSSGLRSGYQNPSLGSCQLKRYTFPCKFDAQPESRLSIISWSTCHGSECSHLTPS